jgi:hypothetical protein
MAWIHVRHRVGDYNQWKQVYDETAEYKRHQGWKRYRLFQVAGDRGDLIVMEQFATVEQARDYAGSEFLQKALAKAGVVGAAEILVLDGLEEGPA